MSFFIFCWLLHFAFSFLHFYWYGPDRAQVPLLVWPPQWHGHTDTVIGMADGHTGPMQRYAPASGLLSDTTVFFVSKLHHCCHDISNVVATINLILTNLSLNYFITIVELYSAVQSNHQNK